MILIVERADGHRRKDVSVSTLGLDGDWHRTDCLLILAAHRLLARTWIAKLMAAPGYLQAGRQSSA